MNKPIIFYFKDTMIAVSLSLLVMLVILAAVVAGGIGLCVWYLASR